MNTIASNAHTRPSWLAARPGLSRVDICGFEVSRLGIFGALGFDRTVSIAVAAVAARADAARHLRILVEGKGGVIARPSVLVVKVCVGSERAKEGSDFCSRPMI